MSAKGKVHRNERIKISSIIPISDVNGPGSHYTIWVQGCSLNCSGCFNPQTHNRDSGQERKISELFQEIYRLWLENEIVGVTFTGGEPLQQLGQISSLSEQIKAQTNLGIIILTGYNPQELQQLPNIQSIIKNVDLIIAGRFVEEKKIQMGLKGSSNKKYLFTSDFYNSIDLLNIPPIEVIYNSLGEVIVSGIEPDPALDAINSEFSPK